MDSEARYSIHVSKTLDCMGYNKDMINYRIQKYKEMSDLFSYSNLNLRMLFVGSKGEGLSAPVNSDFDNMGVYEEVVCSPTPGQLDTVFEIDSRDSPPGYTKLKLINAIDNLLIVNSLVRFGDRGNYISSEIFLKYNLLKLFLLGLQCLGENMFSNTEFTLSMGSNGPAGTGIMNINGSKTTFDTVTSFPCTYTSLLDSWQNRNRDFNWPPLEFTMNIIYTDIGYIVPVGPTGSDNQHLEWRICFTTIEQKLIHLLNDTQTKVYVLLKMIAKEIIRPYFKDITSYVMKNVVLWIAEIAPEEQFREDLLIDRLMQAFCYLNYCVKRNCLPSYMIPERNLIARKMTYQERLKLVNTLNEIISCGGTILLRCEKFKILALKMFKVPHQTLRLALKRDLMEKLYLLITHILHMRDDGLIYQRYKTTKNSVCIALMSKLLDLVIPGWTILDIRGRDFEYYLTQTLQYYFS